MPIDRIEIENFKSIKKQTIQLKPINLLIGGNGAGKTNLIQFFMEAGIETLLQKCPRFEQWIKKIQK